MPALIDYDLDLFGGKGDWETDPVLTPDAAGFDSVRATLCFRGTGPELYNLFPLGSLSCPDYAGKKLYYTGPRVLEARFGFQIAELEWKGMAQDPWNDAPVQALSASAFVRTLNITMTTQESLWPREANGNTLYLGPPYAPPTTVPGKPGLRIFTALTPGGPVITTAELPWRVRLIGRAWAVSMTGIIAGPRSVIIKPPKCMVTAPTTGGTEMNWQATGDPLVTWADETAGQNGWVCRNYELSSETPLGSITLSRWSAQYEWVQRYGP
jgi:hypothetical protein